MLFREIIAVYCDDHKKHIHALCGTNAEFFMLKQMADIATGAMHFEGDCTRVLSVFAITSQQGITYN
jgi:hypothetical protein